MRKELVSLTLLTTIFVGLLILVLERFINLLPKVVDPDGTYVFVQYGDNEKVDAASSLRSTHWHRGTLHWPPKEIRWTRQL